VLFRVTSHKKQVDSMVVFVCVWGGGGGKKEKEIYCTEERVVVCIVCLYSWHYSPLWLYFHSPVVGFSLLVFEVS
jgi:hypothetical protein